LASEPRKTRVIALMNQKGGVGKTTTTVNLGAALAQLGSRVLFVDLDPQGHLSLHLGVDPSHLEASVYDLIIDPDVTAESVTRNVGERLDVIPAEVDLAAAEQELANEPDKQLRLKAKLKPLLSKYDYIFFDCPPSLGLLTLNGLAAAGEVIVPMQAHFLALQGLSKLLETVQLVRQGVNTSLKVSGVVLAMHEANTNLAMEVVADLKNFFDSSRKMSMPWSGAVIYQPPIRRNIKLAESPSFGQTIFQYAPFCPGAVDYQALAESVRSQGREPKAKAEAKAVPEVVVAPPVSEAPASGPAA
jgi:chromosome partitioning protein